MSFDIDKAIALYRQEVKRGASSAVEARLRKAGFINRAGVMAVLDAGGTIASAYSPALETIVPKPFNPALETLSSLQDSFGILDCELTGFTVFSKDSREIVDRDLADLAHVIGRIKNRRILLTCGTYMLPRVTEMILLIFGEGEKIIGVTGSMLPIPLSGNDVAANVVSACTLINDRAQQNSRKPKCPSVFAVFHGRIFDTAKALRQIDLHPKSHRDTLFSVSPLAREFRLKGKS